MIYLFLRHGVGLEYRSRTCLSSRGGRGLQSFMARCCCAVGWRMRSRTRRTRHRPPLRLRARKVVQIDILNCCPSVRRSRAFPFLLRGCSLWSTITLGRGVRRGCASRTTEAVPDRVLCRGLEQRVVDWGRRSACPAAIGCRCSGCTFLGSYRRSLLGLLWFGSLLSPHVACRLLCFLSLLKLMRCRGSGLARRVTSLATECDAYN